MTIRKGPVPQPRKVDATTTVVGAVVAALATIVIVGLGGAVVNALDSARERSFAPLHAALGDSMEDRGYYRPIDRLEPALDPRLTYVVGDAGDCYIAALRDEGTVWLTRSHNITVTDARDIAPDYYYSWCIDDVSPLLTR